ncbi:MAG: hypothetical protein J5826_10115 [Bacteroidales bacterium]|nr:hypothetical protein [Bacteroidales bacterium]
MADTFTNSDRILQAVLKDDRLIKYGNYDPSDYETIEDAAASDNYIVGAVAKIIDGKSLGKTDKEIYNEVNHFLQERI